jgi:hypothetical protein
MVHGTSPLLRPGTAGALRERAVARGAYYAKLFGTEPIFGEGEKACCGWDAEPNVGVGTRGGRPGKVVDVEE